MYDTHYTITSREVEAVVAAMQRVGTYAHLDQRSFQIELAWILQSLPLSRTGEIIWRRFDLGKRLFQCLGEAQGWRCCYCGFRTNETLQRIRRPSIEHVVPKAFGGADHPDNLVMACIKCNLDHGTRTGQKILNNRL